MFFLENSIDSFWIGKPCNILEKKTPPERWGGQAPCDIYKGFVQEKLSKRIFDKSEFILMWMLKLSLPWGGGSTRNPSEFICAFSSVKNLFWQLWIENMENIDNSLLGGVQTYPSQFIVVFVKICSESWKTPSWVVGGLMSIPLIIFAWNKTIPPCEFRWGGAQTDPLLTHLFLVCPNCVLQFEN